MSFKKNVLKNIIKLPPQLNNFLLAFNKKPEWIYGEKYKSYQTFIDSNHHGFDNTKKLIDLVNYAIQNIPYYKNLYAGLRMNNLDDFRKGISFIDKQIVMSCHDDFISLNSNKCQYDNVTTGGTSGKPLNILVPKDRYIKELGTMHFLWSKAGYKYQTRAVIRNHHLLPEKDFVINPITKEVIFDGFRLCDDYFEIIYTLIKRFNIQFIHCYPSTAYEFSRFLYDSKKDCSFIKAFLSGSENIIDYQKNLINNKLGVKFYNWYGHSEKLLLGGYCQYSDYFHMEPTYGYFELIDEKSEVIDVPGKVGEIVGTTLDNYGMPLIRYRTDDYAEYVSHKCEACCRELSVIKNIKGRWSGEKIYNKDGTFVTTTALNLHDELYAVINGIQFVQKEKGMLTVMIIKSDKYNDYYERKIIEYYKYKLKPDTEINIVYVDKLIKQSNGKFLHLISKVT
ncbi:MAG: phenylacetate--CoA ligase family protein [Candidatus Margulisiibacteriota bacterium]|nr:MAG: hypothetical protein A2X43_13205 [Candidatus Margulisbacteria bacterium GWD2_39_127]OGI04785.1 MAG: hypothetical protein A2X42_10790 [Candidatus Margulisbacteria bacterium GWF2_38_17]OGI05730.1 MAG: hypothetical protein A2X41_03375 [Candidatus Margulisbacteria bacterium GWE2_39_32]PZM83665.1 MAG: phenylacetate--CoA ligase family protein [Candidatus Margulisiibacteriota bacterium]HAR62083.1 CoF synthetase [Candidatus Margulisiibacteriota bacterium]